MKTTVDKLKNSGLKGYFRISQREVYEKLSNLISW